MSARLNPSKKSDYLLMSERQLLNLWCEPIRRHFRHQSYGIYLVGSVHRTRNFRDVDLRMMMADKDFDKEFPDAKLYPYPRGKLAQMNTAFSLYAQQATGLPIDFQFQRATEANEEYPMEKHPRNAMGIKL